MQLGYILGLSSMHVMVETNKERYISVTPEEEIF